MNTIDSKLKINMAASIERADVVGECVQVQPSVMMALLTYIDELEQVSQYADSVCLMLTEGGWQGKREALESRIAAAIKSAQKINQFYGK